mgnify:CR=1 FL=1
MEKRNSFSKKELEFVDEDMEWAIKDYIPPRSDYAEVARMSLLALLECSSQSLMPDNWQELASRYAEILTGREHKIVNSQDAHMVLNQSASIN